MRTRHAGMSRLTCRCVALSLAVSLLVPLVLVAQSRSDVIAIQQSLIQSLSPRVMGLMTDAMAARTVLDLSSYPGEARSQRVQYSNAEASALALALKLPLATEAERLRCDSTTTKRCELLSEGLRVVAFSQPEFKDGGASIRMVIFRNTLSINIDKPEDAARVTSGHCFSSTLAHMDSGWVVKQTTVCPHSSSVESWKLLPLRGGNRWAWPGVAGLP